MAGILACGVFGAVMTSQAAFAAQYTETYFCDPDTESDCVKVKVKVIASSSWGTSEQVDKLWFYEHCTAGYPSGQATDDYSRGKNIPTGKWAYWWVRDDCWYVVKAKETNCGSKKYASNMGQSWSNFQGGSSTKSTALGSWLDWDDGHRIMVEVGGVCSDLDPYFEPDGGGGGY